MTTKIQWTDETWNPVRGCTIVSEGCRNCYAMKQAHRFSGEGGAYEGLTRMTSTGPKWTGSVRLVPDRLNDPLKWRTPRRVFVNSMSDLFHPDVPIEFIAEVFDRMASATPECGKRHEHEPECWTGEPHIFQILTKRPERMRQVLSELPAWTAERWSGDRTLCVMMETGNWPLPNVWMGVSAEDQLTWNERVPILLETSAAVHWVSAEPLLNAVDPMQLEPGLVDRAWPHGLDWVVVGGESGLGARPCDARWIRDFIDFGKKWETPVFVKQLGSNPRGSWRADDGPGVSLEPGVFDDRKGGNMDEWPGDLRVREWPQVMHLSAGAQ